MATNAPLPVDSAYHIRSVERVCDILNLLGGAPEGVSLVAIADSTGLPKSSAFRYLATLESRRYVERDPVSGDYRLGMAIVPLQAREAERLVQRARPHLKRLRDELGETVNLGRLDGARVIYLDILESPQAMRLAARRGDYDYLHSTALGKAIAAGQPEKRVREILASEGMPRFTDRTITDPGAFMRELERVRRRGFAVDDGENERDARCIAVRLPGLLDEAISVSAPGARLTKGDVSTVGARLSQVAADLNADLAQAGRTPAGADQPN